MSDQTYDHSYEPGYLQPPPDRSLKVAHLVFGLLFLGGAALWALGESGVISGENLAILGPAVLIVAGVIGLAASLASGRNRRRSAPPEYAESYDPTYPTQPTTQPTTQPSTQPTTERVTHEGDDEPTEEIR